MLPDADREVRQSFLNGCLVESNSLQDRRARRVKQRALLASIILQILIVAALMLVPLLSKGENIADRSIITPTVPYARGTTHNREGRREHHLPTHPTACRVCPPRRIPPVILEHYRESHTQITDDGPEQDGLSRFGSSEGSRQGIDFSDGIAGQKPPVENPDVRKKTPIFKVSEPVQAAMLLYRVQPVYPPLAIQVRREGRVELRAIIAVDGTVQSLEVISGDPFFVQSALAAVREWRYRPTILNGQPIEVDTRITVIYTLQR